MSYYLFLDDERTPPQVTWLRLPDVHWTTVRNFEDFKATILLNGLPKHISFDNDLGEGQLEGADCAKWLVDQWIDGIVEFRDDFTFTVHSKNTVRKPWIIQYLNAYMEQR